MPERIAELNEIQIEAFEVAGSLFDDLVDKALAGENVGVAITWHDAVDASGEAYERPEVVVGSRPAAVYACVALQDTGIREELIELAAPQFHDMVGVMWDDTIDYYAKLDQLKEDLDAEVLTPKTGFYSRALEAARQAEGFDGKISQREVTEAAFQLACVAVEQWADAVDAAESVS